ncbi:MAG: hypothetical protein PHW84_02000 [Methanosarcina sp.]|nr:hypothetical protein [Methanosarcina sp.]
MTGHVLNVDDTKYDELIEYIKASYAASDVPVGYVVNNVSTSPLVSRIDKNEEVINPGSEFFHNHQLWKFPLCTLTPAGVPTFAEKPNGYNFDGTHLDFSGASGDLMVRVQNPQMRCRYEAENDTQIVQFAPFDSGHTYFDYHPHAYAGGGKLNKYFYWAAKEAYGYLDPSDSKYKLGSASGKQPITGEVSYPNCPNSGRFTIDDALLFAANKGAGWTITDAYCLPLIQSLFYTWAGTRDAQTKLGLGIVNLESGTGFAGRLTGADNVDSLDRVDYWGTGAGDGTNGQTPVKIWNFENLYGNCMEWVAGINIFASNGTDGEGHTYNAGDARITKRNGTGIIAGTLPYGSYETVTGVSMADGYISSILTDPLWACTMLPKLTGDANSGSSNRYCDGNWYARGNPSIVLSGGYWSSGLGAGIGCRYAAFTPSDSYKGLTARLQFIPK